MKKYTTILLFLTSMQAFGWTIPVSIPLKIGYAHSTSEKKYRGIELGTNISVHEFKKNFDLGIEPFLYMMNSFKNIDPGMLITLDKTIPFNEKWGTILSLGVGGIYFGCSDGDQNIGFNFIEKAEAGIYRKLEYGIVLNLKVAGWHISDAGIRGHGNPGINGYKILFSLQKKI